jgi:hypothetical protein
LKVSNKSLNLFYVIVVALDVFSIDVFTGKVWVAIESFILLILILPLLPKTLVTNFVPLKRRGVKIESAPLQFKNILKYFIFAVMLSIFPAYIYHNQNPVISYGAYRVFGFVFLYHYLHKKKFTIHQVENVVIAVGFIFQFIYWVQARSGLKLFGFSWEEQVTGVSRLMFNGRHIFILSYYIILTRFKFNSKSVFWLLFSLSTIFIMQTRQLLVPAMLLTAYHLKDVMLKSFLPALLMISIIGASIFYNEDVVKQIVNKSTAEAGNNRLGGDRQQTFIYFLFANNQNIYTRIFGEGLPTPGTPYGNQFKNLRANTGFSPSDVGLVGWGSYLGVIWVVVVLLIVIKSLRIKVPKKYIYTRYYMISVCFTLILGEGQFVLISSIVALMVTFFIIDKANYELITLNKENVEPETAVSKPVSTKKKLEPRRLIVR